ncbi:hypothetical protein BC629DRAFT_203145 [Irpex lacteus]|nr:hypothetical protein BC629DRAFT_203145 [Irpex lacteus]
MASHAQSRVNDVEYHSFLKLAEGIRQRDETGVIIPQIACNIAGHPSLKGSQWSAPHKIPSVYFKLDGHDQLGIRLADFFNVPNAKLVGKQLFLNVRTVPLSGLYMQWPGTQPWLSPVNKSFVIHSGDDIADLGKCIAEHIFEFLKQHAGNKAHGSESPWKGWETGRFDLSTLYLLQLDNVAPGTWQPILSGVPRDISTV